MRGCVERVYDRVIDGILHIKMTLKVTRRCEVWDKIAR